MHICALYKYFCLFLLKNYHMDIATLTQQAENRQDNIYTGIDISPGLLRMAHSRFKKSGFERIELYIAPADDLPFHDHIFDIAFFHLSLNFFDDIESFIQELKRVLKIGQQIINLPGYLKESHSVTAQRFRVIKSGDRLISWTIFDDKKNILLSNELIDSMGLKIGRKLLVGRGRIFDEALKHKNLPEYHSHGI